MTDIEWSKKDLNSGKGSSGVSNIEGINGTENGIKQGYRHGSLTKGLVAYYPMERGKGQIIRDAALNNAGQIKGANWTQDSQIGNYALNFAGNAVLLNKAPKGINFGNYGTVSFWLKWEGDQNREGIIGRGDYEAQDSEDRSWHVQVRDDQVMVRLYHEESLYSGESPGEGWNHWALTIKDSKFVWYKNGERVTELAHDAEIVHSNNLVIGNYDDGTYLEGMLEEIRIYNRPLSTKEVKALHKLTEPNGIKIKESSVLSQGDGGVSRWRFDDDSDADTAVDSWGENDGSIEGAVYTSQRVYGSNAMSFDGENDYVEINSDTIAEENEPFSATAWIKWGGQTNPVSGIANFGPTGHWEIRDAGFRLRLNDTENSGMSHPAENQWAFIAFTHTGSETKFYLNGKLDAHWEGKDNSNNLLNNIGDSRRDAPDRSFDGKIDDFRIYNKALKPAEVEKLFNKGSYRINRGDLLQ